MKVDKLRDRYVVRLGIECEGHAGGLSVLGLSMDRRLIEERLAITERHVAEGKRHLARQREIIAELERNGHDATTAEATLLQFEELQALHVADRNRHLKMLGLPAKED